MMILRLDAAVADTTVMGPRWTPDLAGLAVFGGDLHDVVGGLGRLDQGPGDRGRAQGERILVGLRGRVRMKISR